MKNQPMFTPFMWQIGLFCLPIFLWPLALMLSTSFFNNVHLMSQQALFFASCFWLYPFVLGFIGRCAFVLHKTSISKAKILLFICAVLFYALMGYVICVGFS